MFTRKQEHDMLKNRARSLADWKNRSPKWLRNIRSEHVTVVETAWMHLLDSMLEFSRVYPRYFCMLKCPDCASNQRCGCSRRSHSSGESESLARPHLASCQCARISMEKHGAANLCTILTQTPPNLSNLRLTYLAYSFSPNHPTDLTIAYRYICMYVCRYVCM